MVSKPKGNQVQVLGYYSPEAAEQLRRLSKATRIPQAALLREALDDLLALNRRDEPTARVREVRNALKKARPQLVSYQKELELKGDAIALAKCQEAIAAIDSAREEVGN